MRNRPLPRLVAPFVACLVILGARAPAHAQQDVIKLAERLNKKAMEDYDSLEFDSARQTLLSAIAKLRDAGADETPTAAKIYLNLGVVYISGFKDHNRGVREFVNALKIDGTTQLDPERATPELQEAFSEAQKQAGVGGRKPPPDRNNPPVDNAVKGLQHVAVRAQLGSDVGATRLFLFYRSGGREDYVSVPMSVSGPDWVGTIPGEAMEGKSVQYYLEARDARGRPVIAAGTAASPYIISVTGSGGPSNVDVDVDNPLANMHRKKHPTETKGRGFGRLFLNIMGGFGMGIEPAGNTTEVAWLYENGANMYVQQPIGTTGIAFEPFHIAAELGVNITRHWAVSVIYAQRLTLTNNADSSDPAVQKLPPPGSGGVAKATSGFSVMARVRYNFGGALAQPFVHVGLGAGQIRHVLDISSAETPDHPLVDSLTASYYNQGGMSDMAKDVNEVCVDHTNCVDTIAIGYLLAAVGGGVYLDLVKWKNGGFGVILDADLIFALPVGGQFGVNLDVQLGVGAHFL